MPLPVAARSLPIAPLLPELVSTLGAHPAIVVEAPPGAGKSTAVPLALLDAPWLGAGRILMLEPRRLAARAIATRMAALVGEPVGGTIGYRTRLDSRVSGATRLVVVTEGVLTRMLQSDPALEGTAIVIFDEFHERSLNADLGLAFCLDAQSTLREDLKLLVMSATIDTAAVSTLVGAAPVLSSAGRMHPVETRHLPRAELAGLPRELARATRAALERDDGDVLAFLPGAPEIHRTLRALEEAGLPPAVTAHALFGDLPPAAQDAALAPAPPGRRKVVLATAIAETSLTIDGVRVVVDSGFARRARFDPVTGMSTLVTTRVSRAAADQRRGRAGRTGPGVCYRLWPEEMTRGLEPATPAEILEADLAPMALDLAAWGTDDPASLRLLDPPPAASFAQARELLARLGALDAAGRVSPHGRRMASFGAHPRLAHMMLAAGSPAHGALACDLAAILSERDLLRGPAAAADADIARRLEALQGGGARQEADRGGVERARQLSARWCRELGAVRGEDVAEDAGPLLALAYPDRIGFSRGAEGRYLLANGRGAQFRGPQPLARSEFIVAAEVDAGERESRIFLAARLSRAQIEERLGALLQEVTVVGWDARAMAVAARRERRLGAIVFDHVALMPDPERTLAAMIDGVRQLGPGALPASPAADSLRQRVAFVRRHLREAAADWPDFSDAALEATLEEWLAPWLDGMSRASHLATLDLHAILQARLGHSRSTRLDELAPTHLTVPSGSRVRIDYADPEVPAVAVRLQEIFGLTQTPRLAAGRVPLTFRLLSPAHRPVQVTRDLESFWARGYAEVRKELKGRYPKHSWPEDPHTAAPTRRAKPR